MKHLLIIFILLTSCSKHESKETVNPYDEVKERAASYEEQLAAFETADLYPDRCDRLTFAGLGYSFAHAGDLRGYEYNPGEWHRDVQPCYPDDSRSEISFDGILAVLHYAWTTQDFEMLERLKAYALEHDFHMGEGPDEWTFMPQLGIILGDMLNEKPELLYFGDVKAEGSTLLESTHKEHLLTSSLWLKLRYEGFLSSTEKLALENIKDNPLKTALLARINDGNQDETIKYLKTFPETVSLETGHAGWGSCPDWLYFFLLKAIIDGK